MLATPESFRMTAFGRHNGAVALLAVAAAILLWLAFATQAQADPDVPPGTQWGYAAHKAPIYGNHDTSNKIGKLHFVTEGVQPEVYVVRESFLDGAGQVWVRVDIPGLPNGRHGWVHLDDLSKLRDVHTKLVLNLSGLNLTLYRDGKPIWDAPVGVGKASTPTPTGEYYIRERLDLKGKGGPYGSLAFGTSAYSPQLAGSWPGGPVVGIHGTNQPKLVPGRPSHGCIRVHNNKIKKLKKLMPLGTLLEIVN
jgi:hypothetical protein